MRIAIELPTWLGDAVMVSPAIENLVNFFKDLEITLIGSFISIEALKHHPKVTNTYVLKKNYINVYNTLNYLDEFDLFVSFRGSVRSKFIKFCVSAKYKYQYDKNKYKRGHQVEKYNNFVNDSLNIDSAASNLNLHVKKEYKLKDHKLLGINPGASYGSAKRWYPMEFAEVAYALSNEYDIILFGGANEKHISNDIEKYLMEKGVFNFKNLVEKTTIKELISKISNLDLLVTGDSGPMHIAAALEIPTVSIFGPTKDYETSQWMNKHSAVVKKNLECQPCMKRTCPLNHHNCMKLIRASDVLEAIKNLD